MFAAAQHIQQDTVVVLTSTNLIIFSDFVSREKLWICMEYCGGGSLQDIYHGELFSYPKLEQRSHEMVLNAL